MALSPSELSQAALERRVDVLARLLIVWTAIVVLGLVMEYGADFAKIANFRHKGRFRWIGLWSILGGILVAGGVAGEMYVEVRAATAESDLRTANNRAFSDLGTLVSKAQQDAKGAKDSAGAAVAATTKAEGIALEAETHLAEASTRSARAEKTATDERAARLRLEQTLAGWKLSAEAQSRLISNLRPYKGTLFWMSANPSEVNFMEALDGMLREAGWVRKEPPPSNPLLNFTLDGKASIWYGSGIFVEIAHTPELSVARAAEALLEGLIREGIPGKGQNAKQGLDPGVIHIAIGKRQ